MQPSFIVRGILTGKTVIEGRGGYAYYHRYDKRPHFQVKAVGFDGRKGTLMDVAGNEVAETVIVSC